MPFPIPERHVLSFESLKIAKENNADTLAIMHSPNSTLEKYADLKIFTATTDFTAGHDEDCQTYCRVCHYRHLICRHYCTESRYLQATAQEIHPSNH